MSIEAMKMALEFVSWFASDDHSIRPKHKAPEIAQALRQAIEQEEKQEPMAYVTIDAALPSDWQKVPSIKWVDKPISGPLYTAPPKREWVGLTDSDKQEAFDETQEASGGFWEFADYLEAKLKEKNCV